MLSWITEYSNAEYTVFNHSTIPKVLLTRFEDVTDSIRDPEFKLERIREYFEKDAFMEVCEYKKMKKRQSWKCGTCNKNLRNNSKKNTRSVACERCLRWSHLSCSKLTSGESDWFCNPCKDFVSSSKNFI